MRGICFGGVLVVLLAAHHREERRYRERTVVTEVKIRRRIRCSLLSCRLHQLSARPVDDLRELHPPGRESK